MSYSTLIPCRQGDARGHFTEWARTKPQKAEVNSEEKNKARGGTCRPDTVLREVATQCFMTP